MTFSSFDYETSAQITVKAEVADEGQALVSGRLLADISRSLPAKPVDIPPTTTTDGAGLRQRPVHPADVAGGGLSVAARRCRRSTGTVPSDAFAQAVSQVVVAAGRDELLPVFTGVRVEIEGDMISLLATDRYRMALKELTWNPGPPQISATALVPAKVLNETSPLDDRRRGGHPEPRQRRHAGTASSASRVTARRGSGRRPPGCWTASSPRSGTS